MVATENVGKLREYRSLLAGLPLRIVSPRELGLALNVPEDGATFTENATQKAEAYASASNLSTLADDSGLEVDALGGEPGVRSARYAGEQADDAARIALLLDNLRGIPWPARTARFRCAIAIKPPADRLELAEGVCEGYIAVRPVGTGGFGYDPIFYLPDRGCTMAQVSPEEKDRVSHRARAVAVARPILARLAGAQDSSP